VVFVALWDGRVVVVWRGVGEVWRGLHGIRSQ
jgi:hypothetical protein